MTKRFTVGLDQLEWLNLTSTCDIWETKTNILIQNLLISTSWMHHRHDQNYVCYWNNHQNAHTIKHLMAEDILDSSTALTAWKCLVWRWLHHPVDPLWCLSQAETSCLSVCVFQNCSKLTWMSSASIMEGGTEACAFQIFTESNLAEIPTTC